MPRYQSHHLHLPHFQFDSSKDLKFLYAVRILRDFVNKTAFFFFPIYLFQTGRDYFSTLIPDFLDPFTIGMVTVAGYYVLVRIVAFLSSIKMSQFVLRVGLGRAIAISNFVYILVFSMTLLSTRFPYFLILGATINGFQIPLFWNAYHTMLSKRAQRSRVGQDLGLLNFFIRLAAAVTPAVSGMLIALTGYQTVFLLAIVGLVCSAIVALQIENKGLKDIVSWGEFREWMKAPQFRQLTLSFAGKYFNDAAIAVWPLYVFLFLGSVDRVGYLYTMSLFLAMLLSVFIGFYVDHTKSKKWFFTSGGVLSIIWMARSLVNSIWSIAIVDMLDSLSANFHWLFYDALFIRGGKGVQALSYFTYREMIVSAAGIVFWLLYGFIFVISGSWTALFVLAAVGVFMSLLVTDIHGKPGDI